MEASESGIPAAAEAPQTTEPTATPEPAAPTQEPAGDPGLSDVMAAVNSLKEEFGQFKQQEAPQPEGDLLDRLAGDAGGTEDPEYGQPVDPYAQPDPYGQQQAAQGFNPEDPAVQEFQNFLQQQIDAGIQPYREERQEEQLAALEQKYPDIVDEKVFPRVEQALEVAVRESGNPQLRFSPRLIELAYKAAKAEMADAAAVPAEQVASDGSSLETGAGQSQAGPTDPATDYVQSIYGDTGAKSVFQ